MTEVSAKAKDPRAKIRAPRPVFCRFREATSLVDECPCLEKRIKKKMLKAKRPAAIERT
jgi:hypothetical protein